MRKYVFFYGKNFFNIGQECSEIDRIELYFEFFDSKREPLEIVSPPFKELLKKKYECKLPDLNGRISKKGHFHSPERAAHKSPGQRPGKLLKKS